MAPWRFDSLNIAPSLGFTNVWAIYRHGSHPIYLRFRNGQWLDSQEAAHDPTECYRWAPNMMNTSAPCDDNQFVKLPDPNEMPGELIEVEFEGCQPMHLLSLDGWVGLNGWVPTKTELDKVKQWAHVSPKWPEAKANHRA